MQNLNKIIVKTDRECISGKLFSIELGIKIQYSVSQGEDDEVR